MKVVKYQVACIPEKMQPADLIELAYLFNTVSIGWVDGYMYVIRLSWNESKPHVHYVTEIIYAKCNYSKYAVIDKDREIEFSDNVDHLNATIRIFRDNGKHPLRKAVITAIKEAENKIYKEVK